MTSSSSRRLRSSDEARHKTVKAKLRAIANALETLDERLLTVRGIAAGTKNTG